MKYHLLTGATGLLGRYLLRDLTLAEVPVAVVVRPSRIESAEQRIETVMAVWERQLGRNLIRPVVLAGDITRPQLGLPSSDIRWLSTHCDTIVHSAASLTFQAEEQEGEPWRSNIGGTRHVLELCRHAGIGRFHHVSTAYVCGRRRGLILESELDVGQEPSNDYEATKLTAEKEVLQAKHLERVTVHRPSIIVGDSETGFTTSYHGYYTPLRLIFGVLHSVPWQQILDGDWLGGLDLQGDERKNLVPVNWVSELMTYVMVRPELHGQTYHLTNPHPVTVMDMVAITAKSLSEVAASGRVKPAGELPTDQMISSFREQMKVYQSYWSDDPAFDSRRTTAAAPHLPCPEISWEVMERLNDFAIRANFGWPREPTIPPRHQVERHLKPWLSAAGTESLNRSDRRVISLRVSGSGGGQWHVVLERGRPVSAAAGLCNGESATCYLNSDTFSSLASGRLSCAIAVRTGKLFVEGNFVSLPEIARLFRDLALSPEAN